MGGDGIDSIPNERDGKADNATPDGPFMDVIFSPQAPERSHNARIAAILQELVARIDAEEGGDGSSHSIDIAMYSFSDAAIKTALGQLVDRGVPVRMIFEPARKDKGNPAGTKSAGLEEVGIDVRYINKIMHHKFMILDGPQQDPGRARTAILVTGSGNWSGGAATRYDENTVFMRGKAELVLRMQREFDLLWHGSRDLVWDEDDHYFETSPVTEEMIAGVEDPSVDVAFTSANFQLRGSTQSPSFRIIPGRSTIADVLVDLIEQAQSSIHIASGHLRSRPVADALVAWHEAHPDGDLRIYLDGQEYLSSWYHQDQLAEVEACLEDAGGSETAAQRCWDKGFLFSYQVHSAGVPLRYKFYAYRWDTSYADQMHNKFFIFDGQTLASGSYNLSDNAEHDTMENMIVYRDEALATVFETRFESLWTTGEAEGLLEALTNDITEGEGDVPLVFTPMALDWEEVAALKETIADACPAVDSTEYKRNAAAHRTCPRE
jgi:phosphatidylserine/phosphatidylglycerophosphate/cardiolipin synthase-like enzyme